MILRDNSNSRVQGIFFRSANGFDLAVVVSVSKNLEWRAYIGSLCIHDPLHRDEIDVYKWVLAHESKLPRTISVNWVEDFATDELQKLSEPLPYRE